MKTQLDENLFERWIDGDEGQATLDAARREHATRVEADDGSPLTRSHVGRATQRLSEACRFSGLLDEALELKDQAIAIWSDQQKTRATFLVRLQRAVVLAELAHETAGAEMQELWESMEGNEALEPYYVDFWLEYEARRLFRDGAPERAAALLHKALKFRRDHRASRIVDWTEHALTLVVGAGETV